MDFDTVRDAAADESAAQRWRMEVSTTGAGSGDGRGHAEAELRLGAEKMPGRTNARYLRSPSRGRADEAREQELRKRARVARELRVESCELRVAS